MVMSNVNKKSSRGIVVSAAAWAVSYTVALWVLKKVEMAPALGAVCVALPVVGFVWFLFQYIRGVQQMDEVARRIQLEATAIAFCLSILMLMLLGLIDLLVTLNPNDWSPRHLVPFCVAFYFAGLAWAKRRYS